MDRGGVSGAASGPGRGGKKKARGAAGLKVKARDGTWHVTGTVRAARKSRRVRKGTGLPARAEFREAAEAIRRDIETEIVDELAHGIKPSVPAGVAVDQFRKKGLSSREHSIGQDIVKKFGTRKLSTISVEEWRRFVDQRNAGLALTSRERYIAGLNPFLKWCHGEGWLTAMPEFEHDRDAVKQKHRRALRVAELTPELIRFMIDHAAPHFAAQVAIEWSTGARVSSVLYGARLCDVILAPGRSRITFHDTKNGEPVVAALSSWAAEKITEYLKWRGELQDREAPLFVTHRRDRKTKKRQPYADTRGLWGGQNKTAWRGMRARTVKALLELADKADGDEADLLRAQADLVGTVTQHWFRHLLATTLLSQSGDLRLVMEQGGWLDTRSVMGYAHDVPERRHKQIERMFEGVGDAPPLDKKKAIE